MFYLAAVARCAFACASPETAIYEDGRELDLGQTHQQVVANQMAVDKVPFGFLKDGHAIRQGQGLVFQFQKERKATHGADTASTEKLTIFVPNLDSPVMDLSDGDRDYLAFYSIYSHAFLGNSGCFGYMTSGTLKFEHKGDHEVMVTIDASFPTFEPSGLHNVCGDVRISGAYKAVLAH